MAGTLQLGGITVLEESGGTVTAPNNLSVTGTISGTLGSSSTIQSGTTFPTGMMLQIVDNPINSIITRGVSTTLGPFSTPFNVTISNCLSTSKILVSCYVTHSCTVDNIAMFALYDNTNSQYVAGQNDDGHFGSSVDEGGRVRSSSFQVLYDPPSFSSGSLQIELYMKGSGGSGTHYLNTRSQQDGYGRGASNIILQEIAG